MKKKDSSSCSAKTSGRVIPAAPLPRAKISRKKIPTPFRRSSKPSSTPPSTRINASHRKEIAKAIAPRNFLNQPVEVLEQVLTGVYPDGLGNTKNVPDRIDFDPFPYHSMAIWILTQMKRWGYIKQDVDYKKDRPRSLSGSRVAATS